MIWHELAITAHPLPGAAPAWWAEVEAERLRALCVQLRDQGARLVSLWGSDERDQMAGFKLHIALATASGLLWLRVQLPPENAEFLDLSDLFPVAGRLQRAAFDLLGLRARGGADERPWLRHSAWSDNQFPLRHDAVNLEAMETPPQDYAFVAVTGDGVHAIAVGPVHAGTIESGHFHFQVVGEKILRLEERFGYKHKGIEKLFIGMDLPQGARLSGRISGDTTVAYAWAYAQAAEGASRTDPPPRAAWLRALFLERERIANHLGDLGALGNDAGLAFGLAQFSRLKEDMLRTNAALFGHRYLMDAIIPGGVERDLDPAGAARLRQEQQTLIKELNLLQDIYSEHAGVQDRFMTTGEVSPDLAAHLGLIGLAGRASGQSYDIRVQFPCEPYTQLQVNMITRRYGDVAARVVVRFEEIRESLRLCDAIAQHLPAGEIAQPLRQIDKRAQGIGWVEGWRGEVLVALDVGADQRIRHARAHDPSWQNWPVLEYAVIGNIVPDFPLINKSFNLSYSGHDL